MTGSARRILHSVDGGFAFTPAKGGLVGRDAELARLEALVGEVAAGRGRSVWVEGEPGIGKTALLAAGLNQVEAAGCELFVARADEAASRIFPLQVLLDGLRVGPGATDPARAEIAELLWGQHAAGAVSSGDPVAAAAELLLILVDRLCAAGPVVLAVDDLQWADETSLAVWSRLGHAVKQLPLLLVAAVRPVPQREAMDRLRRSLTSTDPVELRLGPLERKQVAVLVQRLVSVPPGPELRGLLGQAGGNPLYVRELVDGLSNQRHVRLNGGVVELVETAKPPPVSLAAAIGARLNFLSETATRVLRLAAVLGVEFRVEHLSLVTDRAPTSLTEVVEEAMVAGVLAESGTGLVFRHGLIHQALYESIPGALRHALHHQVARALAVAAAPAEAVAAQLLAAPGASGQWAVDWLVGAARTLTVRAPQVALDLLQRICETMDAADPRRALLDVHTVEAHLRLGRYEDVETLARALLANTRDPETVGQMTWTLARTHVAQGHFEQALAVIGQALTEQATTDRWCARLRAGHASVMSHLGRLDEALRTAKQAEADGELAGNRVAVAHALYASLLVHSYREDTAALLSTAERALAVLGDAAARGNEAGASDLLANLLLFRARALWNLGRKAEARPVIGQALTLAERAGTASVLASQRVASAECCFLDGRWDDALVELEAAVADLPPDKPERTLLRGIGALIAVHRDDQTTMRTHLPSAEEGGSRPVLVMASRCLSPAGWRPNATANPNRHWPYCSGSSIRNRRDCFR